MQTTLQNKKKAITDFLSALKRKNRVEEGIFLGLGVKREHESIDLRAHKMMKGRMEPSIVLTMVKAVPTMVHAIRQIATVPQMTSPHERQPREQK